jgi:DNA-binding transcriptional regulator LsrR (DeoR family)
VAGGPQKHAAIRAALLGGWVDTTLVTDTATAEYLVSPEGGGKRRRSTMRAAA